MGDDRWIDDAIGQAIGRVQVLSGQVRDFPHITTGGAWQFTSDGVWTGGFWAGMLWLAHANGGQPQLLDAAIHYTDRLLPRAQDAQNHDLGFMFYPSAVTGWRATGNDRYRQAALQAAKALAGQFNPAAGFIPGWGFFGGLDWSGSVLVDTLMNLPLLAWAVGQGAPDRLLDVVRRQVATTLTHHLRPDGSVYHVYAFDPATGRSLGGRTYQGLGPDSAWARGQAWAVTGLAMLAGMIGDAGYAAASTRVARYFLDHVPACGVPPWDFAATGVDEPWDSSAAAIASYGLQRLYRITGDRQHLDAAAKLLRALVRTCVNGGQEGGLLLHATADLPHGLGVDGSAAYGDYYYLKSLVSLRGLAG